MNLTLQNPYMEKNILCSLKFAESCSEICLCIVLLSPGKQAFNMNGIHYDLTVNSLACLLVSDIITTTLEANRKLMQ